MSDPSAAHTPTNPYSSTDSWAGALRHLEKRKAWGDHQAGRSASDVKLSAVWERVMRGRSREDQLSEWNEFKNSFLDLTKADTMMLSESAASKAVVDFKAWDSTRQQPESLRELLKWWDEDGLRRDVKAQVDKFNAMLEGAGSPNRYTLPKGGDETVTAGDSALARKLLKPVAAIAAAVAKAAKQKRAERTSKSSTANKPDTTTNRPKKKS